jgi:CheY-like chemotaxis protein
MTVFMGAIERLKRIDENPEHRQLLVLAQKSSQCLYALVNDILDFSKIEAKRMEIAKDWFNLREYLHETVTMMTSKAHEKGLRLELAVSPTVPESIVGDQSRIGQVLINLIGNAIKFTDAGEVKVAVQCHEDTLEFAVSDTGIGIPEDKQEKIFQTFSQLDSSTTRRHSGTGLGLAISKGLSELMGGQINVRSRLGQGSVFTFTLPIENLPSLGSARLDENRSAFETIAPMAHILLAEDNPMVREMILITLSCQPWQTATAKTGKEAVRKWQTGNFDLILMDLQMPDMDGLEATREIRRLEANKEKRVGIIGLTAYADRADHEKCLNAGMNEVLVKPFEDASLYEAIERCLVS